MIFKEKVRVNLCRLKKQTTNRAQILDDSLFHAAIQHYHLWPRSKSKS